MDAGGTGSMMVSVLQQPGCVPPKKEWSLHPECHRHYYCCIIPGGN